ncbi:MAG: 2Fe-2S iron-sulfur cluster binding domain-containing protein [Nitrospinaceae bacterium]|jgi:NAD(P)H-flavin reductase/ferredoxin|nr:2Fe-2S iron-sulfur cluster binding domain-containing protein [Nitrospinaceae bacterium]MBT3432351.1 2Fe-2S iron-sulfur cluster binding domain-containing protein [Nitrospinaceae bacterium]MBT3821432.1 2Fe-2S iron-sulfur cluster binding domain-containing protein [Nitrospinaceae bacterium]MBT4092881.1 2Fe-2S iron-sulfur cluster binding domain-containing protein [Nitrospinaceae bacterium]MBT4430831.1 2Fe-2S iron-sulfur cluster binding domain-containing protein [Nitrospinaceae bacterium]
MVEIRHAESTYESSPEESVLDVLMRNGTQIPYSCKKGTCLTCMLKARSGSVPPEAQAGLKETLRLQGYFLACICTPQENIEVEFPDDAALYSRATVYSVEKISSAVCRVLLEPAAPLFYHAGQFINIRRNDGLTRSYSLASVPRTDKQLELHVKKLPRGQMSNWIYDELKPGEHIDFQGPNGTCFYTPGSGVQPLLLIGNGTGLAPLYGIARDALLDGHKGPIHLYHGSRHPDGLYFRETLLELEENHSNFTFFSCLSGEDVPSGDRAGRAEKIAFSDHLNLKGMKIFLCGYPAMVNAAQKKAYLAGADLQDIYADAFEMKELRKTPRD